MPRHPDTGLRPLINAITISQDELSVFVQPRIVQHPLQVTRTFGFIISREIRKEEFSEGKAILAHLKPHEKHKTELDR